MNETSTEKRHEGMAGILRKVHPRHVIWFLMTALFAVILFVGAIYDNRLIAVESHIEIQNGTLHRMEVEQQTQKVNIEWIRATLEKKHP